MNLPLRIHAVALTLLALQPGEELVTVAAGDTMRWIVGDTSSGAGDELRVNVLFKPVHSGLKTNLVITSPPIGAPICWS